MDQETAKAKHQQANALFARGDHAAALALLDELLDAFPGNAKLLNARERMREAWDQTDPMSADGDKAEPASKRRRTSAIRTAFILSGAALVVICICLVPASLLAKGERAAGGETAAHARAEAVDQERNGVKEAQLSGSARQEAAQRTAGVTKPCYRNLLDNMPIR